ncbi:DUF4389 domain-containing protein [Marinibactrum halimedae]|uniref:DUF4389 domain-containing protein n=1 Tax=Marinibactrum halimedae TaxID=1444977 RepID=A0AA37T646_9GAMM|nr:DUF4389 domain-containing protein [Marinibactrum halimedae]MCD9458700.1 DUF4389 domain-containing protein [Marinibactrum halimedae]GLS25933.1 hypothetical protein GCM10007877_16480 [Marinibactrum halimedae]
MNTSTDSTIKHNLLSSKPWLRLIFMLLFLGILQIASIVISGVIALQFLFSLFTGKPSTTLTVFGGQLSQYIYQALAFLTYQSEQKPYPFDEWPEENVSSREKVPNWSLNNFLH